MGNIPWHPFLAHFPIALWVMGSLILCGATMLKRPSWRTFAWFLLAGAALAAIPTAVTGASDYADLAHLNLGVLRDHRDCGNLLPWFMGTVVLVRTHVHFTAGKWAPPLWVWCIICLAISGGVLYTAYLGGHLVYGSEYGFGRFL